MHKIMNKKIALVKLIRNSIIIPNEDKLALLGEIEQLGDGEMEALGRFLSAEHDFIFQNETGLRVGVVEIMKTLKNWKPKTLKPEVVQDPDKVYIGVGKAG